MLRLDFSTPSARRLRTFNTLLLPEDLEIPSDEAFATFQPSKGTSKVYSRFSQGLSFLRVWIRRGASVLRRFFKQKFDFPHVGRSSCLHADSFGSRTELKTAVAKRGSSKASGPRFNGLHCRVFAFEELRAVPDTCWGMRSRVAEDFAVKDPTDPSSRRTVPDRTSETEERLSISKEDST